MRRLKSSTPVSNALRVATVIAGGIAAGSVALSAHFARQVLTPPKTPDAGVTVWSLEASDTSPTGMRIWIDGPDADLVGQYSFIWGGGAGHARLGDIVDTIHDGDTLRVCRDVLSVDRGTLVTGVRGRITGWWFTDPRELGYPVEEIEIPVDGGSARAWLIHPEAGTEHTGRWAVLVHGRAALPEETLRGVGPLARAGITSLVIEYRNDPDAPPGLNGRYGLGLAEHRDIDDAISWAVSKGADRVTLMGWSMGATAAVLSATTGPFRHIIDGLVLDSPALDWPSILRRQAEIAGLPYPFARLGMVLMQRGWVRGAVLGDDGTDINRLTADALAAALQVPTLIHVSAEDTFVPWDGALQFARNQPELVLLREATGEHVRLWNVDPKGWEESTEIFVRALSDPRHATDD